jgi:Holliday junction resolvase RusA-like endonuclease
MNDSIEFFVPGIPAPGGSKRAFVVNGRAVVTDDSKRNKPWRACVSLAAREAYRGDPLTGPLDLEVTCYMPRPKSHYRSGKMCALLKLDAPERHTKKPDATKLLRAIEDALTGIVWQDDAQISDQHVYKRYCSKVGARVVVRSLAGTEKKPEAKPATTEGT